MSGKDFYEKLIQLGYMDYMKDQHFPESLKPSPKSLDWLFAFPKIKNLLNWLINSLPSAQFIANSEMKSYKNLSLLIPHEKIQEIAPFLQGESYVINEHSENPQLKVTEMQEFLTQYISEQEQEIHRLNQELREKEKIDVNILSIESGIQERNSELEEAVLEHLDSLSEICPVVSLPSVQKFVKADEETSQSISNYAKIMDLSLNAIDVSIYQHCLRSERASEFSNLCREKKNLEELDLECSNQLLLSTAAYEKYKAALKSFEAVVLNPDRPPSEAEIIERIRKNKEENQRLSSEIQSCIEKIEEISTGIKDINSEQIDFQNVDLLVKKQVFFNSKLGEMQKLVESQQKLQLLALSGLIIEQDEIQQEYDKLLQIQNMFEEMNAQVEFRISSYEKYKIKAESVAESRKTVDERDKLLNSLYQTVEEQKTEILNFEDLCEKVDRTVKKSKEAKEKQEKNIEKFNEDSMKKIEKLRVIVEKVKSDYFSDDCLREASGILKEIDKQTANLEKFTEEFENAHKELISSVSGTNERQLFVEYLTCEHPEFLKECDLIQE